MTRQEAIEFSCATVALAYHSIGKYEKASDGFCAKCHSRYTYFTESDYRNDGEALRYVRRAVLAKLKADGLKVASGFNPKTGDETK